MSLFPFITLVSFVLGLGLGEIFICKILTGLLAKGWIVLFFTFFNLLMVFIVLRFVQRQGITEGKRSGR